MTGRSTLTLYVSSECCLCDAAVAVLAAAHAPDFECVDIEGDADLEARHGTRVPVLADGSDSRELAWPFDVEDVRAFLARD